MNNDCKSLCRTCLSPNNTIELFPPNGQISSRSQNLHAVVKAVEDCYGIEIRADDEYSTKLCQPCIKLVTYFHSSKQYARSANSFLLNCSVNQNLTSLFNSVNDIATNFPLAMESEACTNSDDIGTNATPTIKTIGTTIDLGNIIEPSNKRVKKESNKAKDSYSLKRNYVKKLSHKKKDKPGDSNNSLKKKYVKKQKNNGAAVSSAEIIKRKYQRKAKRKIKKQPKEDFNEINTNETESFEAAIEVVGGTIEEVKSEEQPVEKKSLFRNTKKTPGHTGTKSVKSIVDNTEEASINDVINNAKDTLADSLDVFTFKDEQEPAEIGKKRGRPKKRKQDIYVLPHSPSTFFSDATAESDDSQTLLSLSRAKRKTKTPSLLKDCVYKTKKKVLRKKLRTLRNKNKKVKAETSNVEPLAPQLAES